MSALKGHTTAMLMPFALILKVLSCAVVIKVTQVMVLTVETSMSVWWEHMIVILMAPAQTMMDPLLAPVTRATVETEHIVLT